MAFDSKNVPGVGLLLGVLRACFPCLVTIALPRPIEATNLASNVSNAIGSKIGCLRVDLQAPYYSGASLPIPQCRRAHFNDELS